MINIKIVSVGNGGMNAVNHMIDSGLTGAEFIACNFFEWKLGKSKADKKILLGKERPRGLGADLPERSIKAAIESREEIFSALRGADAIIIVAGLGGCDGTGAAPIIAGYAKELGALIVAVVSLPYKFEGPIRTGRGEDALKKLSAQADAVIKFHNDKISHMIDPKTPVTKIFVCSDEIMCRAVRSLISIFQSPFRIEDVAKIKISESTPDV